MNPIAALAARWLFLLAIAASWLLGAALCPYRGADRSLPGRLPTFAGWLFVAAWLLSRCDRTTGDVGKHRTSQLSNSSKRPQLDHGTHRDVLNSLELVELLERILERLVTVLTVRSRSLHTVGVARESRRSPLAAWMRPGSPSISQRRGTARRRLHPAASAATMTTCAVATSRTYWAPPRQRRGVPNPRRGSANRCVRDCHLASEALR